MHSPTKHKPKLRGTSLVTSVLLTEHNCGMRCSRNGAAQIILTLTSQTVLTAHMLSVVRERGVPSTYLILDVVGLCRLSPFNCPSRYSGPVCSWMRWWRWR